VIAAYAASSALAFQTPAVPNAFGLSGPAPGTSGNLRANIAGAGEFGSAASFTVAAAPATSATAVLRTSTVFQGSDGVDDRNIVMAAVQLRDAANNTRISTSGLAVRLYLADTTTASATCTLDYTSGGLYTCSLTVPAGWFGAAAGSASAEVRVEYIQRESNPQPPRAC
jgi:hypothetical protein